MKRLIDLIGATVGLLIFSPLLIGIAIAVRLKIGHPVLFRQVRPGYLGQHFEMLKFRTMTNARDAAGKLLPDIDRLTPLGRLLRETSLDELPELWNVLRGDMSLVGPRPLLTQYLERYTAHQTRRHEARPGITGWAQIKGRNAIGWDQKLDYDVWYVDHRSIGLDLLILFRTLATVVRRSGISQDGQGTTSEFLGTVSRDVGRHPHKTQ